MVNKRLFSTLFIAFTNLLGATIIIPILPLFAAEELGSVVIQVVLLDTAYYAAKFVATPILGRLSDRYGRRPLLLASQGGTVFSFLLFSVALPLGEWLDPRLALGLPAGLVILYAARLLDGFTGGNTSITQAYVSDISRADQRAQALGYLSAAMGIGFILGPVLGGVLAAQLGLSAPFWFGASMAAVGLALTALFLPESLPLEQRGLVVQQRRRFVLADLKQTPLLARLVAIGVVTTLCFAAISPTFSLYAHDVLFVGAGDTAVVGRNVGLIFMLVGVVIAVTQGGLLKPIVHRLGEQQALLLSQICIMLAFFAIPRVSSPWGVALLLVPVAFGYSVAEPTLQAMVSKAGAASDTGRRLGMYQSGLSFSYMLGPIWAGVVYQQIAPQALWMIGGALLIPSALLALSLQLPQPQRLVEGRESA